MSRTATTGARPPARLIAGAITVGLALLGLAPAGAYPRPGLTERVSVASDGTQGDQHAVELSLSGDGRYVAFASRSANLVPVDTNDQHDVFVHDRVTRSTERVSIATDGTQGDGNSRDPSISADGRYVAFISTARTLHPDKTGSADAVFVRDRVTRTTEWITGVGGIAQRPSISADGRYVAFYRVPGFHGMIHDRATGTTEVFSVTMDGANAPGLFPSLSGDGRYVAFASSSANLVPGDGNGLQDVFVRDLVSGTTERVSVASDGTEGDAASFTPSISADGRYVSYYSFASNLVPTDTNGMFDIFVHDRARGTTERVSVASDGSEMHGDAGFPSISADGRYVAFKSFFSNRLPGPTLVTALTGAGGRNDVFVHDRLTGATELVSVARDGGLANSDAFAPSISGDGAFIAFLSTASNLIADDTNQVSDAFVRHRGAPLGILGGLTLQPSTSRVQVTGAATFSGAIVSEATDHLGDGNTVGPLSAADVGAELTGAAAVYRPEEEDVLLRLRLDRLPDPVMVLPVVYGLELAVDGVRHEVRAVRRPSVTGVPQQPEIALYRCATGCERHALLSGAAGSTGVEITVSVPLADLDAEESSVVTGLRAFTGLGDVDRGVVEALDEVVLPDAMIPAARVELGIASSSTPVEEVAFAAAGVVEGAFSGGVPTTSLPPGSHRLWARACLGEQCGAAVAEELDVPG